MMMTLSKKGKGFCRERNLLWDAHVDGGAVRELRLRGAAAASEGSVSRGEMLISAASVVRTQSAGTCKKLMRANSC